MRSHIVLLLIIFSSLNTVQAQRLYPDSGNTISENKLSMVIPPDTSVVATIAVDSIPNLWFDTEEGWRFPGYSIWTPAICVSDMVWLTVTITVTQPTPPLTETALGLLAADAPSPIRHAPEKNVSHAARFFSALVATQNSGC